ncbi:hypothetical protein BV898_00752 [Hypsibius exemplaris]|uniref:Uncharacterized protein n=1 Tax=Hypsibius exemplaris TaxID=2072580 RepID=A0A1W0XEC7_HYPEX|nr:hypothetical protein BV898_00752 [Hypsibius exemplaris]
MLSTTISFVIRQQFNLGSQLMSQRNSIRNSQPPWLKAIFTNLFQASTFQMIIGPRTSAPTSNSTGKLMSQRNSIRNSQLPWLKAIFTSLFECQLNWMSVHWYADRLSSETSHSPPGPPNY